MLVYIEKPSTSLLMRISVFFFSLFYKLPFYLRFRVDVWNGRRPPCFSKNSFASLSHVNILF